MNMFKILRYAAPFLYMGLIFLVSSIPGQELNDFNFFPNDKVIHFTEYAVLGFITSWAFIGANDNTLTAGRTTLVVLLGWIFAFSDELHQYFVPNRAADPYDLLADMIGVLAGLIFYIVLMKKIYPRLKSV